ncbi:MAG TPA: saccharopine dehydrogenase NADP-binding domain-containing protein [Caulobacteraceae bacterium]|jgi:short subunit dehydrogenase-like uncharacterized protein
MSGRALLYGVTGFTGREVAERLRGLDIVVAGRDAAGVRAVAGTLGLSWRAFPLTDADVLDEALSDIDVVLHAAGPFEETAAPMLQACLRTRTHYLDLNGEWPGFVDALVCDGALKAVGVMAMPGVGLTIVATDCLLALAVATWPDTVRVRLGVSQAQVVSRGSVASAARLLSPYVLVRRNGDLVSVPAGSLAHAFDFGEGLREAAAMSWADVVTGPISTGVGDIEVYSELGWPGRTSYRASALAMSLTGPRGWRRAGEALAAAWPKSPSGAMRERARFVMVVEALDAWRRPRHLRMRTFDGYTASVLTAAAAVRRVLAGDWSPGFQTPSLIFGPRFMLDEGAAELEAPFQPAEACA